MGTHGTLVGLDRHLQDELSNEKSAQSIEENLDSDTSTIEDREEYNPAGTEKDPGLSTDVPHTSQLSNDSCDDGIRKDDGVCLS
jgi:hypothetical protein